VHRLSAAVALVAVCAGSATAADAPLLALSAKRPGVALVRVHPETLRELPGARVPLGHASGAWSFSPDGSRLAIGSYKALGLRIVDARRLRVVRDIQTRNGSIAFAAWLAPRRILGWELHGVFAVDPVAGRMLRYESLEGNLLDAEATRDSVIFLLTSPQGSACRLAVAGLDGRARFVTIDRARCSLPYVIEPDEPLEIRRPGLAVDPDTRRAFVVGAGDPLAEIDLRTLTVSYFTLHTRTPAKFAVPSYARTAEWLGGGMLAVTGVDTRETYTDKNGVLRAVEAPVGLRLIDTVTRTERQLDETTTALRVAAGTLLAFGDHVERDGRYTANGIRAYRLDGSLVFHALAGEPVWRVDAVGNVIYAGKAVLDASGRIIGRLDSWPPTLISGTSHRAAV
jgi:hypothetical protein